MPDDPISKLHLLEPNQKIPSCLQLPRDANVVMQKPQICGALAYNQPYTDSQPQAPYSRAEPSLAPALKGTLSLTM